MSTKVLFQHADGQSAMMLVQEGDGLMIEIASGHRILSVALPEERRREVAAILDPAPDRGVEDHGIKWEPASMETDGFGVARVTHWRTKPDIDKSDDREDRTKPAPKTYLWRPAGGAWSWGIWVGGRGLPVGVRCATEAEALAITWQHHDEQVADVKRHAAWLADLHRAAERDIDRLAAAREQTAAAEQVVATLQATLRRERESRADARADGAAALALEIDQAVATHAPDAFHGDTWTTVSRVEALAQWWHESADVRDEWNGSLEELRAAARAEERAAVERELESGLRALGLRPHGTELLDLVRTVAEALEERRAEGRRDVLKRLFVHRAPVDYVADDETHALVYATYPTWAAAVDARDAIVAPASPKAAPPASHAVQPDVCAAEAKRQVARFHAWANDVADILDRPPRTTDPLEDIKTEVVRLKISIADARAEGVEQGRAQALSETMAALASLRWVQEWCRGLLASDDWARRALDKLDDVERRLVASPPVKGEWQPEHGPDQRGPDYYAARACAESRGELVEEHELGQVTRYRCSCADCPGLPWAPSSKQPHPCGKTPAAPLQGGTDADLSDEACPCCEEEVDDRKNFCPDCDLDVCDECFDGQRCGACASSVAAPVATPTAPKEPERYVTGAELERDMANADAIGDAARSYAEAYDTAGGDDFDPRAHAAFSRLLDAARRWMTADPKGPEPDEKHVAHTPTGRYCKACYSPLYGPDDMPTDLAIKLRWATALGMATQGLRAGHESGEMRSYPTSTERWGLPLPFTWAVEDGRWCVKRPHPHAPWPVDVGAIIDRRNAEDPAPSAPQGEPDAGRLRALTNAAEAYGQARHYGAPTEHAEALLVEASRAFATPTAPQEPEPETPDEREAAIVRRLAGEWGEIEVGPTESIDDVVSHIHGAGTVIMRMVNEVGDWRDWALRLAGRKMSDWRSDKATREAVEKLLAAAVKRGRTPEDVERDYAAGPEDFGGEDYSAEAPDETTRPAPLAAVPRVGAPPEPWTVVEGGGLGRDDLRLISRPWHSGTMYAGVSYKGWLTCFVDDASMPTAMPPEAAAWLLAKTSGRDPREPVRPMSDEPGGAP